LRSSLREIIFNFDAYQRRRNSQLCTHNNDNHLRFVVSTRYGSCNDEMQQKGQGCESLMEMRDPRLQSGCTSGSALESLFYIWLCPLSCARDLHTAAVAGQSHTVSEP
jgi:hypothetical protein